MGLKGGGTFLELGLELVPREYFCNYLVEIVKKRVDRESD